MDRSFPVAELRPDHLPPPVPLRYRFPEDFLWGVATSSYQIEGGADADGKGESIWDRFSHTPGKIADGATGDVACDHYHRWAEDIELIKALNLSAYRFSLSWPRLIPNGAGAVNPAGVDFYDRLIDGLLEARITPFVTLYHWDLPQALQDAGGWPNRATCDAYLEYAHLAFEKFGDRVNYWITFNEPSCVAFLGYARGDHAPGLTDLSAAIQASHHINVAHGMAVRACREMLVDANIGITLNVWKDLPADDTDVAAEAAARFNDMTMYWYLDPVLKGEYPSDILERMTALGVAPEIAPDDYETIAPKIDFLGLNYYWMDYIKPGVLPVIGAEALPMPHAPSTAMDWKIIPEGLYETIADIHRHYGSIPIYITENGAALDEAPDADGVVQDDLRILYVREHLIQVYRALASDFDVRGYFLWTLVDNFEWSFGFTRRFGLFRLDGESLDRIAKKSASWYAAAARDKGFV